MPRGAGGAGFVAILSFINRRGRKRKADEWTIESWKTEPRLGPFDLPDPSIETAPPLWKDLMVASVVAVLLWAAAAIVFA